MNILTTIAHLCYVICTIIKVYVYLVPPARTGDDLNDPDMYRNPAQTWGARITAIRFWSVFYSHTHHEGQMRIEMFKADIKFGQCDGRFHTTQKGIKKNIP